LAATSLIESGLKKDNINFKITYESITLEEVRNILSEENIKWREVNKAQLIGYDMDDNISIEIIRDIKTKSITVILEKNG